MQEGRVWSDPEALALGNAALLVAAVVIFVAVAALLVAAVHGGD